MKKGDRVRGERGVFDPDCVRDGVVLGLKTAIERGQAVELAYVKLDNERLPVIVPARTLEILS